MTKSLKDNAIIPIEIIHNKIYIFRGEKVMLDSDLASLYCVPTKRLNEQVKRNNSRFPEDFMFQLTENEYRSLRSQNATLKPGQHRKYYPFVFTEQGVAMLSSILKTEKAINVNIQIMRVFTKMRELMLTNQELRLKVEQMECKYDEQFQEVFEVIRNMLIEADEPVKPIGFDVTRP